MHRAFFAETTTGAGAAALNRVFEEYLIPIMFCSEQLHLFMKYNDIDPAASPMWFDDEGNVLAAALVGFRGRRGWIGGFGVGRVSRKRTCQRTRFLRHPSSARSWAGNDLPGSALRQ